MMSARGKPKRLKDAWIKTLHMIRDIQRELQDVNKELEKTAGSCWSTYMVRVRKKART